MAFKIHCFTQYTNNQNAVVSIGKEYDMAAIAKPLQTG